MRQTLERARAERTDAPRPRVELLFCGAPPEGRTGTQVTCPACEMRIVDAAGRDKDMLLRWHQRLCPGTTRAPASHPAAKQRASWRRR